MAYANSVTTMSETPDDIDRDEINIRELIKSLEPDELGKFEPMSGLMLINLSNADFDAARASWSSVEGETLLNTMCHETYHGIQTGASGYGFDRQQRLFAVFNSVKMPDPIENSEFKGLIAAARAEADEYPELKNEVDRNEAAARLTSRTRYWKHRRRQGTIRCLARSIQTSFAVRRK